MISNSVHQDKIYFRVMAFNNILSRNNLCQGGNSLELVKSTRQIIRAFEDVGGSKSRAGKIELANRRVQFNTFIAQNQQVIQSHEKASHLLGNQTSALGKIYRESQQRQSLSPIKQADFDLNKVIHQKYQTNRATITVDRLPTLKHIEDEKFGLLKSYFARVKQDTKPRRSSFLASEMVAISLDNPRELRRIDRLKKQKRELESSYKEFLNRDNAQGQPLSQLMQISLSQSSNGHNL